MRCSTCPSGSCWSAVPPLAVTSPDVVVLDVARAEESLLALHRAPLVICAVVAPDAGSLLTRWLSRLGLGAESLARLPLAGGGMGVVYTALARHPEGRVPFLAARLALDDLLAAAATAPMPMPASELRPVPGLLDVKHRGRKPPKPAGPNAPAPAPDDLPPVGSGPPEGMPRDALQALAHELQRQLREAA